MCHLGGPGTHLTSPLAPLSPVPVQQCPALGTESRDQGRGRLLDSGFLVETSPRAHLGEKWELEADRGNRPSSETP